MFVVMAVLPIRLISFQAISKSWTNFLIKIKFRWSCRVNSALWYMIIKLCPDCLGRRLYCHKSLVLFCAYCAVQWHQHSQQPKAELSPAPNTELLTSNNCRSGYRRLSWTVEKGGRIIEANVNVTCL